MFGFVTDFIKDITGVSGAEEASKRAARDLRSATERGIDYLGTGREAAIDALTGARGMARRDITGALETARGDIGAGFGQARTDLTGGLEAARGTMDPYLMGGRGAYDQYLAQLGMAPEGVTAIDPTQTAAFQNIMGDITERNREMAASAGLLGSGVQAEDLARSISGAYTTDYLNRLAGLGQMGQQAGQFMGGMEYGAGQGLAGLSTGEAQLLANLGMGAGTNLANIATGIGSAIAGQESGAASNIANLLMGGTGQATQADIAAASYMPQMMGDIIGAGATAAGMMFGGPAAAGAVSDRRLKADILRVGDVGPLGWYTWTWQPESGLTGIGQGFIADEVAELEPEAVTVGSDGYSRVHYDKAFEAARAA